MLDAIDKRILVALHENARLPLTTIAKQCAVSREVAEYRVERFTRQRVITGFVARINQSYFAQGVAALYCKLARSQPHKYQEILTYLKAHKKINWVAETCGASDFVCTIFYTSAQDLAATTSDITAHIKEQLRQHRIELYITEYKFERLGLITEQARKQPKADTQHFESTKQLDDIDKRIVGMLAQNCRATNVEIAARVNLSEDMVRLRIKKLEEKQVITGYTIVLNPYVLDMQFYILSLQLEQVTEAVTAKIRLYAQSKPYISYCARTAGQYNVVLSIYAKNQAHFNEILIELRMHFGDLILDYEFLLGIAEHKEVFVPEEFTK